MKLLQLQREAAIRYRSEDAQQHHHIADGAFGRLVIETIESTILVLYEEEVRSRSADPGTSMVSRRRPGPRSRRVITS